MARQRMLARKPVGRNAQAQKYDILSALSVHALSGDKHAQRLALRVMCLITTRYNWRTNELSIGREEIARLWSVNERTVKRDMARLRSMGWVSVKRPGARGRVTVYQIDLARILQDTRPAWELIGPDFVARQEGDDPEPRSANVIPFQPVAHPPDAGAGDNWAQVQAILHDRDPELWSSWFRHLTEAGQQDGCLNLYAPSRFMADYIGTHWATLILAACSQVDPAVRSVRIHVAG